MPFAMRRVLARFSRSVFLLLTGAVLFVAGSVASIYSPWFQDNLRRALVAYVNRSGNARLRIDSLRLRLPLNLDVAGVSLVRGGDTLIAAKSLDAAVNPLPLLGGRIDIVRAGLTGAVYAMGNRDSATMMVLRADTAALQGTVVRLSPMKVTVRDGLLSGADIDLFINPDPPRKAPADTAAAKPFDIAVKRLQMCNLTYRMNMLPTIDSLGVTIGDGVLNDAVISLGGQDVNVKSLTGRRLQAAYIAPDSATVAMTKVAPPDTLPSKPWTVRVGRLAFDRSSGLYATRGVKPQPGLDFAYIEAKNMTLAADSFYNRAGDVVLPLRLTGTERCGLTIDASGTLAIDSAGMSFRNFALATPAGTSVDADGRLGAGDLMSDPKIHLGLAAKGTLVPSDVALMFPAAKALMAPLHTAIGVCADVSGTSGVLNVNKMTLSAPGVVEIDGKGTLDNVFDPLRMAGRVVMHGTLGNVDPWLKPLLATDGIGVPALTADIDARFAAATYSAAVDLHTQGGTLAFDGDLRGNGPDYTLDVRTEAFPLQCFLTTAGISDVTATVSGRGHGFDPSLPTTVMHVDGHVASMRYAGQTYTGLTAGVTLEDSHARAEFRSDNPGLRFRLEADARFQPHKYDIDADISLKDIDLMRLQASAVPANVAANATLRASFDPALTDIGGSMRLTNLNYNTETARMYVDDVTLRLNSTDSVTNASVRNRDLYAYFSAPAGIRDVAARFGDVMPVIDNAVRTHKIDIVALQKSLPQFNLDIDAGRDNALTQMLAADKMRFGSMKISAFNDSTFNIKGLMTGFASPAFKLDTVRFDIDRRGAVLDYGLRVRNRPGTFDAWAKVDVDGTIGNDRMDIAFVQRNIHGVKGFDLAADLSFEGDSAACMRFTNHNPVIGYQDWTVNPGNFITYDFAHRHLDADLHMNGPGSRLALYTENAASTDSTDHTAAESLIVDIADIHVQDWIKINPFAPAVKGDLSAKMKINAGDGAITGTGQVGFANFWYGKERVGNFRADLDVLTTRAGRINADVGLWVNDVKTVTLRGALNDSTARSPLDMDLRMIHFPLATANAFLPGVARLEGSLDGQMRVTGTGDAPRLDGWLEFDSAQARVDMLGTTLKISGGKIAVDTSMVHLDKFAVFACNDNPLTIDGTVDLRHLSNAGLDLRLDAGNMLLVDSRRAAGGARVYGKAYAGAAVRVHGDMRLLNVDGTVRLQPGTNVTYVMTDAAQTLQSQSRNNMVKFVNFADTAAVVAADSLQAPEGTMLIVNANLAIDNNTVVNVDLGAGGSDRVQVKAQGNLNYTMSPINAPRLTGRLNIDGGYVHYTPPFMGEKKFDFEQGSYVAFTGDMLNPMLNVHAVDRLRANVTQAGANSRLIYFDILLGVTGTLNNMNVAFDLATDDDATVANELASMSPSQRASEAMNMLVTNMYNGGNTTADANLGGNALYSFLTSQLNSWAANTIKGVDLSFGVNQYDDTRAGYTTQATQYSYSVSKSLFNDRFKIVVGGNYTDGGNADENVAQNLVNDISFEYLLNKQGTMVARIFRHTGYESILEGEITETGVGFVYKRKIRRLSDMFRFARRRKRAASEGDRPATAK